MAVGGAVVVGLAVGASEGRGEKEGAAVVVGALGVEARGRLVKR